MGYNPREHVCELFDLECMRKIDRNVYMCRGKCTVNLWIIDH
jgi:hypothetical protein